MTIKAFVIIFATVISIFGLWTGSLESELREVGQSNGIEILKDKKIEDVPLVGSIFSQQNRMKITRTIRAPFIRINHCGLADKCRENPLMFGMGIIFIGMVLCGAIYVFYLVQSDSRFS